MPLPTKHSSAAPPRSGQNAPLAQSFVSPLDGACSPTWQYLQGMKGRGDRADALTIADDDFLTREQANTQLGRLAPDVLRLDIHGLVVIGRRESDGLLGVSAASLTREVEWRSTAGPFRWLRRLPRSLGQYL